MKIRWEISAILIGLCATPIWAAQRGSAQMDSVVEKARQAATERRILYKLTTPEELKAVLGPAVSESKDRDGGMEMLVLQYPDVTVRFTRMRDNQAPFTLQAISGKGGLLDSLLGLTKAGPIDIGQNRPIVLRSVEDLAKFDPFWGFAGVSLAGLDLRDQKATLEKMPFDSRTQWPARDRLPEGFDPLRRLEEGKSPGLGVAGLHAQNIDGHGVGIAIIDQPLLQEHQEYVGQLVRYEPIEVSFVGVQMHGPPVCSIAVGQKCGVAPRASLYYYAVPPWKWLDNRPWAEQLEKVIEFNKTLTDQPKIKVVSISLGAFSQRPNFDLWKVAVEKAAQNGILVVTCDPAFLRLATLRRDPNGDPNDPACYTTGVFSALRAAVCVPAGNRTTASHHGPEVYTYWIEGGMSWAVPYLAGLAALAFQIDPEIPPAQIVELWTSTATKTSAGPIVNPSKFIAAVQAREKKAR